MRSDYSPQDAGFDARVRNSFAAQAMMSTAGAEITSLRPGWIEIEMPHRREFTQQHGYTHAGLIATAMDSACGYAALSLMPAHSEVLTVEYKVNLLRPARSDRYYISAHVIKAGRTLTVSQASARDGSDKEVAVMTGTLMAVLRPSLVDRGESP